MMHRKLYHIFEFKNKLRFKYDIINTIYWIGEIYMELTFESFKEFSRGAMCRGESFRNALLSDKIEKTIKVNEIKIFYPDRKSVV